MARLRGNLQGHEGEFDIGVVTGASDGDIGIPNGTVLMEFADAAIGDDEDRLNMARANVVTEIGEKACVDAAGVIATFNAIDRVADSTGIPLEDWKEESTEDFREDLGIEKFRELHLE